MYRLFLLEQPDGGRQMTLRSLEKLSLASRDGQYSLSVCALFDETTAMQFFQLHILPFRNYANQANGDDSENSRDNNNDTRIGNSIGASLSNSVYSCKPVFEHKLSESSFLKSAFRSIMNIKGSGDNGVKRIVFLKYLFENCFLVITEKGRLVILDIKTNELAATLPFRLPLTDTTQFDAETTIIYDESREVARLLAHVVISDSSLDGGILVLLECNLEDVEPAVRFSLDPTSDLNSRSLGLANRLTLRSLDFPGRSITGVQRLGDCWLVTLFDVTRQVNELRLLDSETLSWETKSLGGAQLQDQEVHFFNTSVHNCLTNQVPAPSIQAFLDRLFQPGLFDADEFNFASERLFEGKNIGDAFASVIAKPSKNLSKNAIYSLFEEHLNSILVQNSNKNGRRNIFESEVDGHDKSSAHKISSIKNSYMIQDENDLYNDDNKDTNKNNVVDKCFEVIKLLNAAYFDNNSFQLIFSPSSTSPNVFLVKQNGKLSMLTPTGAYVTMAGYLKSHVVMLNDIKIAKQQNKWTGESNSLPINPEARLFDSRSTVVDVFATLIETLKKDSEDAFYDLPTPDHLTADLFAGETNHSYSNETKNNAITAYDNADVDGDDAQVDKTKNIITDVVKKLLTNAKDEQYFSLVAMLISQHKELQSFLQEFFTAFAAARVEGRFSVSFDALDSRQQSSQRKSNPNSASGNKDRSNNNAIESGNANILFMQLLRTYESETVLFLLTATLLEIIHRQGLQHLYNFSYLAAQLDELFAGRANKQLFVYHMIRGLLQEGSKQSVRDSPALLRYFEQRGQLHIGEDILLTSASSIGNIRVEQLSTGNPQVAYIGWVQSTIGGVRKYFEEGGERSNGKFSLAHCCEYLRSRNQTHFFLALESFVSERNAYFEFFRALAFLQEGRRSQFLASVAFIARFINAGKSLMYDEVEYLLRGPWAVRGRVFLGSEADYTPALSLDEFFEQLLGALQHFRDRSALASLSPLVAALRDVSPQLKRRYLELAIDAHNEDGNNNRSVGSMDAGEGQLSLLNTVFLLEKEQQEGLAAHFLRKILEKGRFASALRDFPSRLVGWMLRGFRTNLQGLLLDAETAIVKQLEDDSLPDRLERISASSDFFFRFAGAHRLRIEVNSKVHRMGHRTVAFLGRVVQSCHSTRTGC